MVQIDYFFAVISPFVYLAGDRLEQIAAPGGLGFGALLGGGLLRGNISRNILGGFC